MYGDRVTDAMRMALSETERRRRIQAAYNVKHGITPASIVRQIDDVLTSVYERDYVTVRTGVDAPEVFRTQAQLDARIAQVNRDMRAAAANLEFEKAAALRDELKRLRTRVLGVD